MLRYNLIITLLILALLTIVLVSNLNLITSSLTSLSVSSNQKENNYQNLHSFTKAICNASNFCQDNLIECQGKEIKSISPITGAFVQFDKKWNDPRTQEVIDKLC